MNSSLTQKVIDSQQTGTHRVTVSAGKDCTNPIYFPVQKTTNKVLQKELLRMYLSVQNEDQCGSYFSDGKTQVQMSCGSQNDELNEKYKGFKGFDFYTTWLSVMDKFSHIHYIDNDTAVGMVDGYGVTDECLIVSIKYEDNTFKIIIEFFYREKGVVTWNDELWGLTNGMEICQEIFERFLPEPKPEPILDTTVVLNCCICMEDFSKVSYKCRTCNEGIVCKGCCKKMKGVKRCPICRS